MVFGLKSGGDLRDRHQPPVPEVRSHRRGTHFRSDSGGVLRVHRLPHTLPGRNERTGGVGSGQGEERSADPGKPCAWDPNTYPTPSPHPSHDSTPRAENPSGPFLPVVTRPGRSGSQWTVDAGSYRRTGRQRTNARTRAPTNPSFPQTRSPTRSDRVRGRGHDVVSVPTDVHRPGSREGAVRVRWYLIPDGTSPSSVRQDGQPTDLGLWSREEPGVEGEGRDLPDRPFGVVRTFGATSLNRPRPPVRPPLPPSH